MSNQPTDLYILPPPGITPNIKALWSSLTFAVHKVMAEEHVQKQDWLHAQFYNNHQEKRISI